MLVTWPFVMLLLDYCPLRRFQPSTLNSQPTATQQLSTIWRLVLEKIPFFALAVAASLVTFVVQQQGGIVMTVQNLPLGARIGNALISYCRYLGKMFWPTDLAALYPHPGYWPVEQVFLAGVLLTGISALLIVNRRRYPFLLMGWLWYCGTLVPVIQLVQTGTHAMADRYTYIPSLGVLTLAIWSAHELTRRWRYHVVASSVAGTAAIVLCIALTRQQIGYWKDSEALFRHALEVTEHNYIVHNSLGNALVKKGQIDEAITQFQKALELKPKNAAAQISLGNLLSQKGLLDEAILFYRRALEISPQDAGLLNNLAWIRAANAEARFRDGAEAVRLAERACQLTEYKQPMMVGTLAAAYAEAGRFDEAVATAQKARGLALALEPVMHF